MQIFKMKNDILSKLLLSFSTVVAVFPSNYLSAESHELEVSLQNCYYAKIFANIVIEKKKALRPINFYEEIKFTSPVAMEIVLQAYNTDRTVSEFSNYWFEKCQEIDCNEFWADLEVATKLVSE